MGECQGCDVSEEILEIPRNHEVILYFLLKAVKFWLAYLGVQSIRNFPCGGVMQDRIKLFDYMAGLLFHFKLSFLFSATSGVAKFVYMWELFLGSLFFSNACNYLFLCQYYPILIAMAEGFFSPFFLSSSPSLPSFPQFYWGMIYMQ